MRDFAKMNRVVCGHRWTAVEEWVDCLHRLSELSDDELHRLAAGGAGDRRHRSRAAASHSPVAARRPRRR